MTTIGVAAYAYDSTGGCAPRGTRAVHVEDDYDYDTPAPGHPDPPRSSRGRCLTAPQWATRTPAGSTKSAAAPGRGARHSTVATACRSCMVPVDLSAAQLNPSASGPADRRTAVFPRRRCRPTRRPRTSGPPCTTSTGRPRGEHRRPRWRIATTSTTSAQHHRTLTAATAPRLDAPDRHCADERRFAQALSSTNAYSADGLDCWRRMGRSTRSPSLRGRSAPPHTSTATKRAPRWRAVPLVTSSTSGARVAGEGTDRDTRTSATQYATAADWHAVPRRDHRGRRRLNLTAHVVPSDGQLAASTLRRHLGAERRAHHEDAVLHVRTTDRHNCATLQHG